VYNTVKQDYIWKGEITRENINTEYLAMIAIGFEISGYEVTAGYAALVDTQRKSYFYDVFAKEKIDIPYTLPADNQYAVYRADKYSVAFVVSSEAVDIYKIETATKEARKLRRGVE